MGERHFAAAACLALGIACSARVDDEAPGAADGPLAVRGSIPVHAEPWAIAAHDVNGDGRLDLVVGGAAVSILLGDGAGGFQPAPGTPFTELVEAADFAFGDFDGDGRTDVAVAEHDAAPQFFVLRGTDGGGFELAPGSPFGVDATPHLHTIAAFDFDSDGDLDVVTDSWPESRLVLVEGRGNGTFALPGRQLAVPEVPIQNLRAADLNGDGLCDVVTPAHDREAVTVLLGDGRGSFRQASGSPFRSFGGFSKLELADVDRDGDADVVEVHRSDASTRYKTDALSILLNDGGGRLAHAPGSPLVGLPDRSNELALGDVDGDGWTDAAVIGETAGVVALFRGGESGFRSAGVTAVPGRARAVAVADLDGDGRAEVLVTDSSGGRVVVLSESE